MLFLLFEGEEGGLAHDEQLTVIAAEEEHAVRDLALLIQSQAGGKPKDVQFLEGYPEGQFRKPASVDRLRRLLFNYEFTSLEDGIRETVKWFKVNRHATTTRLKAKL